MLLVGLNTAGETRYPAVPDEWRAAEALLGEAPKDTLEIPAYSGLSCGWKDKPSFPRKNMASNRKKGLLFWETCGMISKSASAGIRNVPVAQLDRVFGYEPKGQGFESFRHASGGSPLLNRASHICEMRFILRPRLERYLFYGRFPKKPQEPCGFLGFLLFVFRSLNPILGSSLFHRGCGGAPSAGNQTLLPAPQSRIRARLSVGFSDNGSTHPKSHPASSRQFVIPLGSTEAHKSMFLPTHFASSSFPAQYGMERYTFPIVSHTSLGAE